MKKIFFWVDEQKYFRTADAVRRRRCEGPHRFTQKRPRTFVSGLASIAAVETSKDWLSRDFQRRSIFDFCNTIPSEADIRASLRPVYFVPNKRLMHRSKSTSLFHYLVGAGEQRGGQFQAQRRGRLQVYDELKFRWLRHRQVRGLFPPENPAHVNAGLANTIGK